MAAARTSSRARPVHAPTRPARSGAAHREPVVRRIGGSTSGAVEADTGRAAPPATADGWATRTGAAAGPAGRRGARAAPSREQRDRRRPRRGAPGRAGPGLPGRAAWPVARAHRLVDVRASWRSGASGTSCDGPGIPRFVQQHGVALRGARWSWTRPARGRSRGSTTAPPYRPGPPRRARTRQSPATSGARRPPVGAATNRPVPTQRATVARSTRAVSSSQVAQPAARARSRCRVPYADPADAVRSRGAIAGICGRRCPERVRSRRTKRRERGLSAHERRANADEPAPGYRGRARRRAGAG